MRDVALVTYAGAPELDPDDRCLLPLLVAHGLQAHPARWDDASVDWSRFAVAVVRSTWDYHLRHPEFLAWIERAGASTTLANVPALLRWNSHKAYLRELAGAGIPVVPTTWIARDAAWDMDELVALHEVFVVKPAVSAAAHRTLVVREANRGEGARELARIVGDGEAMVQPYIRALGGHGEHSLFFIDGALTHAVHRLPGLRGAAPPTLANLISPTAEEEKVARAILAHLPTTPLYARVDLTEGEGGQPLLSELELIEPSLFFYTCPPAASALAEGIARRAK